MPFVLIIRGLLNEPAAVVSLYLYLDAHRPKNVLCSFHTFYNSESKVKAVSLCSKELFKYHKWFTVINSDNDGGKKGLYDS